MRKTLISVLMIPLLLLGGCGDRRNEPEVVFTSFRESLNTAETISAELRLAADFGGTAASYALSVEDDGRQTAVTVREPELIAGVAAIVRESETSLSFDGVMLDAGAVDPEGTTPLSAVCVILRAMKDGYTELFWRDGDYYAARIYTGEGSACTVWLEPQEVTPVAAEIATGGKTVVTCRFTDWHLE